MTKTKKGKAAGVPLSSVTNNLEAKYSTIESLCNVIREHSLRLKEEDTTNLTTIYNNLCLSLLSEIQYFIQYRKETTLPYTKILIDKIATNHDCLECKGNCKEEDTVLVSKLEDSQYKIHDLLARLQKLALPLYTDEEYPAVYKEVRKDMVQLTILINEIFYTEESSLIPMILDAQKNLHATSNRK